MAAKRKYAREEDLKALKERFFGFVDNDFTHLALQVARLEGGHKFERGMLIAVLTVMLSLFIASIFGLHIGV